MANSLALIFVGGVTLIVAWNGRQDELIELLKEEGGFIKWAAALVILWALIGLLPSRVQGPVRMLLVTMIAIQASALSDEISAMINRVF